MAKPFVKPLHLSSLIKFIYHSFHNFPRDSAHLAKLSLNKKFPFKIASKTSFADSQGGLKPQNSTNWKAKAESIPPSVVGHWMDRRPASPRFWPQKANGGFSVEKMEEDFSTRFSPLLTASNEKLDRENDKKNLWPSKTNWFGHGRVLANISHYFCSFTKCGQKMSKNPLNAAPIWGGLTIEKHPHFIASRVTLQFYCWPITFCFLIALCGGSEFF